MPVSRHKTDSAASGKLNEDEQFLQKMLSHYFRHEFINNNYRNSGPELTIFSNIIELSEKLGSKIQLQSEYEERKKTAPVWSNALKLWIDEIENEYLGYKEIVSTNLAYSPTIRTQLISPAIHAAYSAIVAGKNNCIAEYLDKLVFPVKNSNNKHFYSAGLLELGMGVAFAYTLPELKAELATLSQAELVNSDEKNPGRKKIEWKGTPSQLGFIVSELRGKGYLEFPVNGYNKIAQLLLEVFDIRNDDDEPTPQSTLAKEVNPTSNSLSTSNVTQFKIPNKEKLK